MGRAADSVERQGRRSDQGVGDACTGQQRVDAPEEGQPMISNMHRDLVRPACLWRSKMRIAERGSPPWLRQ